MTDFTPIAFITGITLSRFINDIDRFDELILYDVICHNEKNRFAVTFGYYRHELCSEGSYMSALYEKACKTHVISAFYRDNYTVNIDGKPAKNCIILRRQVRHPAIPYQEPGLRSHKRLPRHALRNRKLYQDKRHPDGKSQTCY